MKLMTSCAVVIMVSAWAVGLVTADPVCGTQAGGARCANFLCCNSCGYCGSTFYDCSPLICQLDCWMQERLDHRCGPALDNPPCGINRCCSIYGWCGSGTAYCSAGNCNYRCSPPAAALHGNASSAGSVSDIISESVFDDMFSHRKDCPSGLFYTYHAFVAAAESFPAFMTTGDLAMRKREVAAFFALISQATSEKMSNVEKADEYGLCHINTTAYENDFCTSSKWPCAPGKKYSPRGAIQLAHNYNYGLAGQALGVDLINNPEMVATDPIVSFKTAMWFWMARHDSKASYHDAVVGAHSDSTRDDVFGDINMGTSSKGFYKRYCDMLGVSHGYDGNSEDILRIRMAIA